MRSVSILKKIPVRSVNREPRSVSEWGGALKRLDSAPKPARVGDTQGRTAAAGSIFHLFLVYRSSSFRVLTSMGIDSYDPFRGSSIEFDMLYQVPMTSFYPMLQLNEKSPNTVFFTLNHLVFVVF